MTPENIAASCQGMAPDCGNVFTREYDLLAPSGNLHSGPRWVGKRLHEPCRTRNGVAKVLVAWPRARLQWGGGGLLGCLPACWRVGCLLASLFAGLLDHSIASL